MKVPGAGDGRGFTIVLHRDGDVSSRTLRVPAWALRTGLVAAALLFLVPICILLLYAPILRAAVRVPMLEQEVSELREENAKVRELAAALDSVEANYAMMRRMLGADIAPDPVELVTSLPVAPAVRARPATVDRYASGMSPPRYWPLDEHGYITRGQVRAGSDDEEHPGVDIAVPIGTPVRASGGAQVLEAGTDDEYGLYVLLAHPGGIQTMYGHLSRLTASAGASVEPGQVIGLSGNSGRSTAPHLHFEVRENDRSVDPMTLIKEGR